LSSINNYLLKQPIIRSNCERNHRVV